MNKKGVRPFQEKDVEFLEYLGAQVGPIRAAISSPFHLPFQIQLPFPLDVLLQLHTGGLAGRTIRRVL